MDTGGKEITEQLVGILSLESREGLELLTALVIVVFSLVFAHIYIVPLTVFDNWPVLLQFLAVLVTTGIVRVLLAATDRLTYGDPKTDKYAKAFQRYWPSGHIATKFGLSREDATRYWYQGVFNKWSDPSHPRHSQWARTLRRGYACRFVYHSTMLLQILLLASGGLTLLALLARAFPCLSVMNAFATDDGLGWRLAFIVLMSILYLVVRLTNRTSPENLGGVWRRFGEINQMHIKWIDENIDSGDHLKSLARDVDSAP